MKVKRFGRTPSNERFMRFGSSISKHLWAWHDTSIKARRTSTRSISRGGESSTKTTSAKAEVSCGLENTVNCSQYCTSQQIDQSVGISNLGANKNMVINGDNDRRVLRELLNDDDGEVVENMAMLECSESAINPAASHPSASLPHLESSEVLSRSPIRCFESHIQIPPSSLTKLRESNIRSPYFLSVISSDGGTVLSTTSRKMPAQLLRNTSGDPEQMWKLMCEKSQKYIRNSRMMDLHPQLLLSMRTVLFDWMMDVCAAEKLHRETFYLAMEYMDRFLSSFEELPPSELQMFGTVAIHIACKFEEVYPPKLKTLVAYTDGACSVSEALSAERVMLKHLRWMLNPLTAIHWLGVYLLLLEEIICECKGKLDESARNKHQQADGNAKKSEPTCELKQSCNNYNFLRDTSFQFSKFTRTAFITMAQVLDSCMLDPCSIKYDYAVLAAAVISCYFEPVAFIEQITGFQMEQLYSVCEFVEPYVYLWERRRSPGYLMPSYEGIDPSDSHNIQTHFEYDGYMVSINQSVHSI
ncbi:unnamed protein product [Anisakis simplex]|uniref:G1/S-specific cyclin-E (inferred by orthology to a C. elegans protein) n=1 Tax=Anisakis simplex TaxID=6269 RepID=A0A0M3K151_ANISI|nr:unnamed protein product [Anisakis simplex]